MSGKQSNVVLSVIVPTYNVEKYEDVEVVVEALA